MKQIIIIISFLFFCVSINTAEGFKPEEYYRLIVQPSFDRGFVIKIENTGKEYKLRYGWFKSDGTYKLDSSKIISQEQWNSFLELLERVKFFEAPEHGLPKDILDGTMWNLTGYRNSVKHTLSRHSPDKYNLVYETGAYLINLCGSDGMKKYLK
ncbi:MAG: hypothetical protein EHM58_01555 [Ignavibacteriae bacterium]|nr:MAG: hypothetical protein EHM58_01555 [Ignavibacteriota bacterium]